MNTIVKNDYATEEDIDAIKKRVASQITECVKFAEESPWPDESELYGDIYVQKDYPFILD